MSDLVKKEQNEVMDSSMFEGMSTGFEQTSADTFKTPFLKILQQLSPELNTKKPEYLKGAEIGMFCNTATKEVNSELDVIVLKIEHSLLVWKPNRGGFAGAYSKGEESKIVATTEGYNKFDADGNSIVDTISFYCVNANDSTDIFILSLSMAMLKHAKTFAQKIRMLKANGKPVNVSFAGVWNIKTVEDSNDKGDWYTIGNTPSFKRFISKDELENIVKPATEILKTAEVDHSMSDDSSNSTSSNVDDSVEY